jgi:hypothetical protein
VKEGDSDFLSLSASASILYHYTLHHFNSDFDRFCSVQ